MKYMNLARSEFETEIFTIAFVENENRNVLTLLFSCTPKAIKFSLPDEFHLLTSLIESLVMKIMCEI